MGDESRIAAVVIGGIVAFIGLFILIPLLFFGGIFGMKGFTGAGWVLLIGSALMFILGGIAFIWGVIGLVRS